MNTKANATSFKKGHKHSKETLEKISASKKGKSLINKGTFKKGQKPHNKKESIIKYCEQCQIEMSLAPWQVKKGKKFCSKDCSYKGRELKGLFEKGHIDFVPPEKRGHSIQTIQKLKIAQRKINRKGENSPNWKGGKRSERKKAMSSYQYKEWRISVFVRDGYKCQSCGIKGGYLEADHIKPWCAYPDLRYDIDNGRTLCKPCHIKQDTYGAKALYFMDKAG